MNLTFASIIPLIGGLTIGAEKVLGTKPEYIASWGSVFGANDQLCRDYYPTVPYIELDELEPENYSQLSYVDIVTILPPCAGLSMGNLSKSRGCNAMSNDHMTKSTILAMTKIKPRAIIVENAPNLFTDAGEQFAEKLNSSALSHGYSMTLIKTSSIYHGLPQNRTRSFFILWKGSLVPILNPVREPSLNFYDFLTQNEFKKSPSVTKNKELPENNPLWQFIMRKEIGTWKLDEWKFKKFKPSKIEILRKYATKRQITAWQVIYDNGWLEEAAEEFKDVPKLGKKLAYTLFKKNQGLNILDTSMILAHNSINALMWKSLPSIMHPFENRYLMTSEALALMGFPQDFPEVSTADSNKICQNCPVTTGASWVNEIKEALLGYREWIIPVPANDHRHILRQNNCSVDKPMEILWKKTNYANLENNQEKKNELDQMWRSEVYGRGEAKKG